MSGAERARAYRHRRKAGIVLLTVAVDESLVAALVTARLLVSNQADEHWGGIDIELERIIGCSGSCAPKDHVRFGHVRFGS
jgi:hypothetical protein